MSVGLPKKSTIAVWGGETDHESYERATQVPVVHSVSFGYHDIDTWQAVALGREPGHIYSRNSNPTVRAFEEKIRDLEGAEAATSFSSGMAAISGTFFALLRPGDRVVSIKDSYGGTNKLFTEFLPAFGIEVRLCATTDFAQLEAEMARGCKLLYLETPTNPTVKIVDIARLARAAHAVDALVVVDNTFATPINQNPLQLGADLVLHSATKYLGGHADALGGAACGSQSLIRTLFARDENAGSAGRETEPKRTGHCALAAAAAGRRTGELPGTRNASAPRGRQASDARLRRHAQLQCAGRTRRHQTRAAAATVRAPGSQPGLCRDSGGTPFGDQPC
jgi:cystathionine gamma-synthase